MSRKLVASVLVASLAVVNAAACGSSGRTTEAEDGDAGTTGGETTSGGESSSGASGTIGSSSGATPPDAGLEQCAAETQKAEGSPLDIFIMLDASGSMTLQTAGGMSKWDAVKTALNGFVAAPTSAGIGVGLGVFPVKHPGAPSSCTSSAECTTGGQSYGKCFTKACDYNGPAIACDANTDCPGQAPCRQTGLCTQGIFTFGECLVGGAGCLIGNCKAQTTSICDGTQCVLADYKTPKVGIAALPGNAAALTSTINALPTPPDDALTPTSAAVTGGLDIAKAYAAAHPGHAVVMVLATDGLPTRCAPMDIPSIANLAAAGKNGTPAIKTFVIGVFSNDEAGTAKPNLDAIAAAGGSNSAFIVNTSNNVTQDFQAALDKIRGNALPCDYAVPKPASGTPDYEKVNVQLSSGGNKLVVFNKDSAAACDANGGWYYDVDPKTGGTPTKIVLCPTTCEAVKQGSGSAQVDIVLGCKTIVK